MTVNPSGTVNVLMLTPTMPMANGAFVGGSVNGMIGLLKGLEGIASTAIVLTGVSRSEAQMLSAFRPKWAKELIPVPLISRLGTPMASLELMARLMVQYKRLSRQYRIAIVHGHSGYALHGLVTLRCARALDVPAIHTVYCPLAKHVNDRRYWLLNDSLARLVLKRLDRVIAISHNVARSLFVAGIPREKVNVIPSPVELDRFDPRLCNTSLWRAQAGIPITAPVILFGGNNTTQAKGLDVFLEAMFIVIKHYPDAVFIWTLFKNEKPLELQRRLEGWGLQNNVRQFAIVDNMPEIMAAADVLVAPFRSTEGPADYPLMLLEAMAMAKAIVTTPVGGIPEVVAHKRNGLLVDPERPDEVAEAVLELIRDREARSNLGQAAAWTVRTEFSPKSVAHRVAQVYQEVLGNL